MAIKNKDVRVGDILAVHNSSWSDVYMYLGKYERWTDRPVVGHLYLHICDYHQLIMKTENLSPQRIRNFVDSKKQYMADSRMMSHGTFTIRPKHFEMAVAHVDMDSLSDEFRWRLSCLFGMQRINNGGN